MKVRSAFVCLVGVALVALPVGAVGTPADFTGVTNYVSKSGSDTNDGKSWATAKKTVQAAVNLCNAGDIVLVDDGDYDDVTDWSATKDGKTYYLPTVVQISKRIYLKSRNGKSKTAIVGHWANTANGVPSDGNPDGTAHRCIFLKSSAHGALVEGFTIRDGSTAMNTAGNTTYDAGGGISGENATYTTYVVDCDFLNCRAGAGGAIARDCRAIRCRFAGNAAEGSNNQCFYRTAYAYNCLFENNGTANGTLFTVVQNSCAVNCTFVNNSCSAIGLTNADAVKFTAINCAFLDAPVTTIAARIGTLKNCVQASANDIITSVGTSCKKGVSKYQYFSPAEDDWSAVVGGDLADAGDSASNVEGTTGVPAYYLTTDFAGNPRVSGSAIDIGCFETAAPKSIRFRLRAGESVMVDGMPLTPSSDSKERWYGFNGPRRQVRVTPAADGDVFGFSLGNGVSLAADIWRFPDNGTDRGFWLTPSERGVTTITPRMSTGTTWVDAGYAGDDSDGSEDKPFKAIPAAIAAASADGVVKVKKGTYGTGTDKGSDHIQNGDAGVCRVSLWKRVAIRAVDGPAETAIVGGRDVATILRLSNHGLAAHVQGFTLTGMDDDPEVKGSSGGVFYAMVDNSTARGYCDNVHVTDSVISNNVSSGCSAYGGWFERCVFRDNFTTPTNMHLKTGGTRGTHALYSILTGCILDYSDEYFANPPVVCTCAAQNATELNCTFHIPAFDAFGQTYRTFNTPNGTTVAYNNAMYEGYLDNTNAPGPRLGGTVAVPGLKKANAGFWLTDCASGTFFVNEAAHDYRPIAGSVGAMSGAAVPDDLLVYETGDINGNALAYQENGASIPGAYQVPARVLCVQCDSSHGSVTPAGNLFVDDGESIEFTATANDSSHRLVGWMVDGEKIETTGPTYIYTADFSKPSLSIEPIFSTDLYVNANAVDDSGDGSSPATAKKTLAAIAAVALSGDTIHAAAGDYKDGQMTQTAMIAVNKNYSPSRIVVPSGVTLVADDGPDVTFITGVGTKGPDGIRCVAAHAGATVRGFTLRNGATSDVTGGEQDLNLGGCALAPYATSREATAFFEDCVFQNGSARNGGCVAGGYLYRCKILYGVSGAGASLAFKSVLDHSIAVGNNNTGVREHFGIFSSVVINIGSGNTYRDLAAANSAVCFENSILACQNKDTSIAATPIHKNVKNCLWNVGMNASTIDDATSCNVVTGVVNLTTLEMALASLKLDANFCPLKDSAVIDRGDNSLLTGLQDPLHDLFGNPRVSNAQVDIGCCEYDWRGDYAAALGCGRRAAVAEVSPAVKLEGTTLTIPAGCEVLLGWTPRVANETATLAVSALGSGAQLLVYRGDELVNTISAAGEYEIAAGAAPTEVKLVADGGSVTVAGFKPMRLGFSVIVR